MRKAKYATIPIAFFRVYHKIMSKEEWLFFCHLVSHKVEHPNAPCCPALTAIAKEMGYSSVRSVRRLRESLEKRGLLEVTERVGEPNIYHLLPIAKRLGELANACQ